MLLVNNQEFNRLTNISFDARMKERAKSLVSKSQVDNALNLGDKNREKQKNIKHLIPVISLVEFISKMMEHKII